MAALFIIFALCALAGSHSLYQLLRRQARRRRRSQHDYTPLVLHVTKGAKHYQEEEGTD